MRRVVVVEDEELVRKGIILTVDWASVDCAVVGEASNGEDGLQVVEQLQPDLIITDIKMPRMDGLEMLRRLRENGNRAQVILLTAYSDFAYAQTALKLGAVDYLLKPFHDGDLEEAVAGTLPKTDQRQTRLSGPELPVGEKSKYVIKALRCIAAHYHEADICVASIADSLGISKGHLSHEFKKATGNTVNSYLTSYRIHVAMQLLRDCRSKVYEVAEQVGYRDITYFSAAFKKVARVTTSEYQKQCQ